jgi:two-component system NtrC family sensor kinase
MKRDLINVLIVEDQPADVDLIRELLAFERAADYEFMHVTRIAAALECLATATVNVILVDLNLPDSTGVDTFRRVYQASPEIPVIVLSGVADRDVAMAAVREGAQDYLVKDDITTKILTRAIRYAIERKRIEQSLRHSEERFRWLASASPVGIVLIQDQQITYANPAVVELLGYKSAKSLVDDRLPADLACPGDRDLLLDTLDAITSGERRVAQLIFKAQRDDGPCINVQLHAADLDFVEKTGVVVVLVDVEQQRVRERILRRHNRELTTLNEIVIAVNRSLDMDVILNESLDAILGLDLFEGERKGAIFLLDETSDTLEIFARRGLSEDLACVAKPLSLQDRTCSCCQAVARREMVMAHLESDATVCRLQVQSASSGSASGGSPHICVPLMARGNRLGVMSLWVSAGVRVRDEDLRLLESIAGQIGGAVDKALLYSETKQRSYEMSVLNRTGQILTSTLDLDEVLMLIISEARSMLQAERVFVLLHDALDDDLVFASAAGPGGEKIEGKRFPADAGVTGWSLQNQQPVIIEDAQHDPRFLREVDEIMGVRTRSMIVAPMRSRDKPIGVLEALNRSHRPFSEHELDLLVTLAGYAAIAIDNAQLYEAEREQRKLVEESQTQLAQSDRLAAIGRLSASLTHELNNPLQAIHNSLQMMLAFPLDDEERQTYISMADEEVERLIGMVNRVLEFSRRPGNELKPLDVNRVVNKVLDLSGKYLQHRHVALEVDLDKNLPPVAGNAGRLGQVFLNLVINAVEAMPKGGKLCIQSTWSGDSHIVVRVSDTGVGIPPDVMGRVFEPFFSTKKQGTGLGLSISHNIVEQHGGEILVQSELGEGTVFDVQLPTFEGARD